jgi:hypothetical protein
MTAFNVFEYQLRLHSGQRRPALRGARRAHQSRATVYNLPRRADSSAGRALRSQCRGREFDPPSVHQIPGFLAQLVEQRTLNP